MLLIVVNLHLILIILKNINVKIKDGFNKEFTLYFRLINGKLERIVN